jgi:hypothetical protein
MQDMEDFEAVSRNSVEDEVAVPTRTSLDESSPHPGKLEYGSSRERRRSNPLDFPVEKGHVRVCSPLAVLGVVPLPDGKPLCSGGFGKPNF